MKSWLKLHWILATFLVFVLAGLSYGFLLRRGEILYSPYSDIIAHGLGTKAILYESLREGQGIPFWRDDQLSGYPALTNPQALYTYPLHFLFYLLEPANAVGGTLWLHFVASACVFYLVAQVLGLSFCARIYMAVAALFNFKLLIAAYAGWLPVIPAITFFPLLFATTFYAFKRPGLGGLLAVAGAGALCLHTGHLQYCYYSALFLFLYILSRTLAWSRAGNWRTLRQVLGYLLCASMLSVGLTAYLIVPLLADAPLISRSTASYTFFLARHALTPRHLTTLLYPEALGTPLNGSYPHHELWEDVAYFGLIPLFLAIVGAVCGRRRPFTLFLTVSFLLSLVMAMDSPLLRLAYTAVPGFQLFRCPSRFLFLTAFFGIALSGIGLDEVLRRLRKRFSQPWLGPVFVVVLLALVTGEGMLYARRYLTTVPHGEALPKTAYERFLAEEATVFRVAPISRYIVNYGWAAPMDLQLITGYDPFNLKHYQAYFDLLKWGATRPKEARVWTDLTRISRPDLLDALNVKYLISPARLVRAGARFKELMHWKDEPVFVFYVGVKRSDIYLYQNQHFMPRAFWAGEVVGVQDETEMINVMTTKNLAGTAVILSSSNRASQFSDSLTDKVEIVASRGGYVCMETKSQASRFLTISEVWHPGWRALIDGKPLQLHQTNLALIGAWIPEGKHRVVLRFRPSYWPAAVGISAFSAAILVFLLVVLCWQFRQKTQTALEM